MPVHFDYLHLGLTAVAIILLILWIFEMYRLKGVNARAREAETELADIKGAPGKHEFRLEQFSVLWYPTVTYDKKSFAIQEVKSGAPYCSKCGVPLSMGNGEFSCAKCGFKAPESVGNVAIIDQIADKAKAFFELRHPTGL